MSNSLPLYLRYQSLRSADERQRFAFANPRLLWIRTVRDLSKLIEDQQRPPRGMAGRLATLLARPKGNTDIMVERLVELDRLRLSFRTIDDYPYGMGPLDAPIDAAADVVRHIAKCLAPDTLGLVAPPYLQFIAYRGVDRVIAGEPASGVVLARCAAEAALALADCDEVDQETFHAVTAYLQASVLYLCERLDPSVRHHAIQAAQRAIAHAERLNYHDATGALCQAMGTLHSDIWIMRSGPRQEDAPSSRNGAPGVSVENGLFEMAPCPEPWLDEQESLRRAVGWYRRAIPYRRGAAKGLTYKAILQTEDRRSMTFGEEIDPAALAAMIRLAAELLSKHPEGGYHLQTVLSIAERRGWTLTPEEDGLTDEAVGVLEMIQAAFDPGPDDGAAVERRRRSHAAAVEDLKRAMKHALPWALYLRNFDFANKIRQVGDVIVEEEAPGRVRIVVPQISYSIVDHKVLELFGEGVVTVCDPALSDAHLLSLTPMLSLRNDSWLPVVTQLALSCTRIVMLLDEVTTGVGEELLMLERIGAAERTLVVCGDSYRSGVRLPQRVSETFPTRVDWLDFSHDERHQDMRHKAHRIVQNELKREVRSDVRQIVASWMKVPR